MRESRLIFNNFESVPESRNKRNFLRGKPVNYEKRSENLREIKEKDKKKKEEEIKVAETMINNLENFGIKCPRCNNKNVKSLPNRDTEYYYLHCQDCNYDWKEKK